MKYYFSVVLFIWSTYLSGISGLIPSNTFTGISNALNSLNGADCVTSSYKINPKL